MDDSLVQKLQLKSNQRLNVLNAPAGYLEKLAASFGGISVASSSESDSQAVLLFVNHLAEVQTLAPDAIQSIGRDGLLWIAYPKGTSGIQTNLNRDRLAEALSPIGWRPVRQIAVDDTWSAMCFRPAELVGK